MCSAAELESANHWPAGSSNAGTSDAAAEEFVEILTNVNKGKDRAKTERPADQHAITPFINGSKTKTHPPQSGESDTKCYA